MKHNITGLSLAGESPSLRRCVTISLSLNTGHYFCAANRIDSRQSAQKCPFADISWLSDVIDLLLKNWLVYTPARGSSQSGRKSSSRENQTKRKRWCYVNGPWGRTIGLFSCLTQFKREAAAAAERPQVGSCWHASINKSAVDKTETGVNWIFHFALINVRLH